MILKVMAYKSQRIDNKYLILTQLSVSNNVPSSNISVRVGGYYIFKHLHILLFYFQL